MKMLLHLALMVVFLGLPALGDEQLRRVQEELRKRNLYFGDIDGRKTNETISAIRRYQERKGFPQTGDVDGPTLSSLNLGPPDPAVASWPDVAVLKSDAALEISEKDRTFLESLPATEPAAVAEPPVEDSAEKPPLTDSPPPQSSPPETEAKELTQPPPSDVAAPSADRAREFVREYLDVCETNNLDAEMAFYADPLNYLNHGVVRREFVKKDVRNYYRRWPERDYELIDFKVAKTKPGEAVVKFRISFRVKSPQHSVVGKTDNTFTIRQRGDEMKFTALKEQRIRD